MTDPVAVSEALPPGKPEHEARGLPTEPKAVTCQHCGGLLYHMQQKDGMLTLTFNADRAPVLQPGLREFKEAFELLYSDMEDFMNLQALDGAAMRLAKDRIVQFKVLAARDPRGEPRT